jgi:hypothetical protein
MKNFILTHKALLTRTMRCVVIGNSRTPFDLKVDKRDLAKFFGQASFGKMLFCPCPNYANRIKLWRAFIIASGLNYNLLEKNPKFDINTLAYISEGYSAGNVRSGEAGGGGEVESAQRMETVCVCAANCRLMLSLALSYALLSLSLSYAAARFNKRSPRPSRLVVFRSCSRRVDRSTAASSSPHSARRRTHTRTSMHLISSSPTKSPARPRGGDSRS